MGKKLLLILLFTFTAKPLIAQNNYCDDITRDTDAITKTTALKSPENNITVKGLMLETPQIWMSFNIKHQSEFISEYGGLFIRFDDGKSLKFFGQPVSRKYISARDGYFYQTDMMIKPDDLVWFKTKKITKYQIAGIDVPVTNDLAVQIQAYIICINSSSDKKEN